MDAVRSRGKNGQKLKESYEHYINAEFYAESEHHILFCETTICSRKMHITEPLNLNETRQK